MSFSHEAIRLVILNPVKGINLTLSSFKWNTMNLRSEMWLSHVYFIESDTCSQYRTEMTLPSPFYLMFPYVCDNEGLQCIVSQLLMASSGGREGQFREVLPSKAARWGLKPQTARAHGQAVKNAFTGPFSTPPLSLSFICLHFVNYTTILMKSYSVTSHI